MAVNLEGFFPTLGRYKLAQSLIWMLAGYILFFLGLRVLGVSLQAFGSYLAARTLLHNVWVPVDELEKRIVNFVLSGPSKGLNLLYQIPIIGPSLRTLIRHEIDQTLSNIQQIPLCSSSSSKVIIKLITLSSGEI